jgi:general secretion pathway protein H
MYFSPEGLVEPMLVQITDKAKLTWTLIFNPLTGRTDIIEKALTLKDLQ